MSMFKFDHLPDELLIKVLRSLHIIDIIRCSQTSRRVRRIAHDKTLWQKLNMFYKKVPCKFVEIAVENKCQYMSLYETKLEGSINIEYQSSLKYLDLSGYKSNNKVHEKILKSCYSLEKLSLSHKRLTTEMAISIWYS